ncbi:MAG: type II toxin-antitoxin system HicB family antitoxin [Rhodospirillales bacterium]|nr:type II toxin-antitoxin system HicB family antitoxin [Rhodospirillales bacterium]
MTSYIALMRKDADSDYGVDFPDFPGCTTAGRTLEEAKDFAKEVLEGHIEVMTEYGEAIPDPSPLDVVMADPENADAVAFLVDVQAKREKAVPVTFTVRPSALARIDAAAAAAGLTRSAFLTDAAITHINRLERAQRRRA